MLPATRAIATETNPATSETRVPQTTRESTSRPTLSVPSQCAAAGRASALPRFCLSGSCGATAGAPTATASAATRMTTPSRADSDEEERHGLAGARRTWGAWGAISGPPISLVVADPGIDEAIKDVDAEVAHDEADGDQQHHALHERIVAREHRVDHQAPHAGQREHVLGDDGAADQRAELQPQHGDDGDQRVLQHVAAHHAALGQPL